MFMSNGNPEFYIMANMSPSHTILNKADYLI